MPKISSNYNCITLELIDFHRSPFYSTEEGRLHHLCPVHMLRFYLDKLEHGKRVTYSSFPGRPLANVGPSLINSYPIGLWRRLLYAYISKGLQPPEILSAHSTGVLASWALCKGISLQEICTIHTNICIELWHTVFVLLSFLDRPQWEKRCWKVISVWHCSHVNFQF